jgi:hypothetical protein
MNTLILAKDLRIRSVLIAAIVTFVPACSTPRPYTGGFDAGIGGSAAAGGSNRAGASGSTGGAPGTGGVPTAGSGGTIGVGGAAGIDGGSVTGGMPGGSGGEPTNRGGGPGSSGSSSGGTVGSGGTGVGGMTPGVGGSTSADVPPRVCLEGATQSCGAAPLNKKGSCGLDKAICKNNQWVGCVDTKAPSDACDPGNDDNCNGSPNEGCPCVNGATQDCGHAAVGVCKPGKATCKDGSWGACVGNVDPKARDCSSTADNDCNGTADSQETAYCSCTGAQTRVCQDHPGLDGKGICKAGSQTCMLSGDKSTSTWGNCTGSVGPEAEVCDVQMVDENCNGQSNEGCDCVGTTATCDCGGSTTCNNGKKGTCAVTRVTMYRDADSDGYGNPGQAAQVCPGTPGYVLDNSDCDDQNANVGGNYSICASSTSRRYCATGGVYANEACSDGCQYEGTYGVCRAGTIGTAGSVSCWNTGVSTPATCSTSVGCTSGSCGTSGSPGKYRCDGPNDCPGQTCCLGSDPGGSFTRCVDAASCTGAGIVCDPIGISPCETGYHCPANGIQLVTCQPN